MSQVKLEFPVLISHRQELGYSIRPFYVPDNIVWHVRYDKAIQQLRKRVNKSFKSYKSNRDNLSEILWYVFNPEYHFELKAFELKMGKFWIKGVFAVIYFQLQGHHFVCLPMLDQHLFMLKSDPKHKVAVDTEIIETIQKFFRTMRKKEGDLFDHKPYLSTSKDSPTLIQMQVNIEGETFPFEDNLPEFFASLFDDETFDGQVELNRVSDELNEHYPDDLLEAYYREPLVKQIHEVIFQQDATCVVVVGPSGCGKTALIHSALREFLQLKAYEDLYRAQKIWRVDPLRIISGMSVVGMWQRRMEAIIESLRFRLKENFGIKQSDYMYVDNLVALFRVGKSTQNSLTIADVLKPYLEKRAFSFIGEATPEAWEKVQELDRRFADLFHVVRIDSPDKLSAQKMICLQRAQLEYRYQCEISLEAMTGIWDLQSQFGVDMHLPGSMVKILKQLANKYQQSQVNKQTVMESFQVSYGYHDFMVDSQVLLSAGYVDDYLAKHLIGQEEARKCLADVVHIIKAQLTPVGKPLASLLFIGPTGVGKTEAAKVLTRFMFKDESRLLRFDMNEYIEADACARLIGDIHQPEGRLTSQVRLKKACVLLLDEIEKAHPFVHDLFLQVLGEGRLTDVLGRTTDFSQCVIIMTSNLGSVRAARKTGFVHQQKDQAFTYREEVERFFRPEFVNRIDRTVAFHSLTIDEMMGISRLQIQRLLKRDGFLRRTTFLNIPTKTLQHIARQGFDPTLGARALKRSIEKTLVTLTALKLVNLSPDQPILFQIDIEKNALQPKIIPFKYADQVTLDLSEFTCQSVVTDYPLVQQQLEMLQEEVNTAIDQADDAIKYQLWSVQDRIRQLKDKVDNICWDINVWQNAPKSKSYFVVRSRVSMSDSWKCARVRQKELFAQSDIRDYLTETYAKAVSLFEQTHQNFLEHTLDLQYFKHLQQGLLKSGLDHIVIKIASCIDQSGYVECDYIIKQYQLALNELDAVEIEIIQRDDDFYLFASGAVLYHFFNQEAGIHLFYDHLNVPIPVAVTIMKYPPDVVKQDWIDQYSESTPLETETKMILRIYCLPVHHYEEATLTDLRSGLMMNTAMQPKDWKILLLKAVTTNTPEF